MGTQLWIPQILTDIRKHFERVINVWNSLPGHVVEAETLGVFKTRLDMVLGTF